MQLTSNPATTRRHPEYGRKSLSALFLGLAILAWTPAPQAATITVDVLTDNAVAMDICELRSAILAANTNLPVNGCAAGDKGELDTIMFSVTGTITVVSDLPVITESLHIDGPGQDALDINGDGNHTLFDFGIGSGDHEIRMLKLVDARSFGTGACIKHRGQSLVIEDLVFERCESQGSGGAVLAQSKTSMNRLYFFGNLSFAGAGAIRFQSAEYSISNSTFENNRSLGISDHGGAIILDQGGTLNISNSTFYQNQTYGSGGAIYSNGDLSLTNSTMTNNIANNDTLASGYGGGIHFLNGNLTIKNSVISGNDQLLGSGSIVRPDLSAGSNHTFTSEGNNLIGSNSGVNVDVPTGIPNQDGDYVGDNANPLPADLQEPGDYGGPTPTMPPRQGGLLVDNGACAGQIADQRGVSNDGVRIVDNPPPNPADGCDIGAVELELYIEDVFEDSFEN